MLDGEILDHFTVWRPGAPDGLGDVFIGRVVARVPAMAGAFVALPDAEGFLPDTEGAAVLTEGEAVAVRVVRTAQGGKGPRLARADPGFNAPGAVPRLVSHGKNPLHRLAAHFPEAEIRVDSPSLYAALRSEGLSARLVPKAFDDALSGEIEALAEPWAALPGGVRAGFFPTPALTAIDMDGGASTAARAPKAAVQSAANRAALPELARQIRLRNVSGAIFIDFAGLPVKRRASLGPALSECLAADPAQPRLLGFTALGLAEILRPRTTPPLHEVLAGPHAAGLAALRVVSRRAQAEPARPLRLLAAPEMVRALQEDPVALGEFAEGVAHRLDLRSDPKIPIFGWTIDVL